MEEKDRNKSFFRKNYKYMKSLTTFADQKIYHTIEIFSDNCLL